LLFTVCLTILVYILDAVKLANLIPIKSGINLISAFILLLSVVLYFLKKISLELNYSILAYTIILTAISGFYLYRNSEDFLSFLLRDSLYLICVITISGLALNRRHAVIFSVLFILNIIILTAITKDPFLIKNIFVISGILIFYSAVFFSFLKIRDGYNKEIEQTSSMINVQHAEILSQNKLLISQQEEITWQSTSMASQTRMLEKKSRDMLDNLIFARNIQKTILPKEIEYLNYLPDSFILNLPKDEISGDFYWIREKGGKLYIAAVDCTGHGMSGALVSMIGFLSLNRAIAELSDPSPADILNKLDSIFQTEFNHSHKDFNARIGMDIALVRIDLEARKLEFSGAFNPLYIVRKGELLRIKANHYMLGIEVDEFFRNYENNEIDLFPGDSMYIFSDGIADQFGAESGKKFTYDRLRKALISVSGLLMEQQREELRRIWLEWKGDHEQTDDILLMGFRL
jgi:serine phosphatase RsbU (regulator of sigma subunit)